MSFRPTALLAAALALPVTSTAQDEGFDAHGFYPVAHDGDPRDAITVFRPGAFTGGDVYFSSLVEYANQPLVRVVTPEFGDQVQEHVALDHLVALNAGFGVAMHRYAKLDVGAPVFFHSTDESGDYQGVYIGDLRVAATAMIIRPEHIVDAGGFGLGVVGFGDIPLGKPEWFLGQGGVAGGGLVAMTYELSRWTFAANLGMKFNPSVEAFNVTGSDSFLGGASIGVLLDDATSLGVEAQIAPSLQALEPWGTGTPGETMLVLRHLRPNGTSWTFGGAGGMTRGAGTARFRAFLGWGVGSVRPPREPDYDVIGSFSIGDACPAEPETLNGWRDDDGCPDQLGTLSLHALWQGRLPRNATLHLTGPDGTTTDYPIGPRPTTIEVMPETDWSAVVTTEACLDGTGSVHAIDGHTDLVVDLHRNYDARVIVEVVDPAGELVPDATVTWLSDTPSCMPDEILRLGSYGSGSQFIGHGSHTAVIEAPGFEFTQESIELEPRAVEHLRVELMPIMVVVEVEEQPPEPAMVVVEKKQIRILDKVQFETAKAVIKPESFDLLNQVAETIVTNPDVGRVEVAGHTDSVGSDAYNLDLSQRRAESVRVYLVGRGVVADRLLPVGYGETQPLDTNETDEGRSRNRRVEFNLIDVQDEVESPQPEYTP